MQRITSGRSMMGARSKRVETGNIFHGIWALVLILTYTHIPPSFALDQETAQNNTGKLNNIGSDDSMEAATDSVMVAIMNLAALNIPGAFSNGYKAYGQYINSEKMDDVEAKALKRRGSMASIGNNIVNTAALNTAGKNVGQGSGVSGTTTFSRLDPKFLYKGKTNEIATEFERQSGMRRETLLKHMASATDSDLNYSDPNLLHKLEARFEAFKADVPNKDFRGGLERAANMFPHSARVETLDKLSTMYTAAWKGSPQESQSSVASAGTNAPAPGPASAPESTMISTSINAAAVPIQDEKTTGRTIASAPVLKEAAFIGIGSGKNSQEMVNEFLSTPTPSEMESIFTKVSRRYKILTPALLGRI